MKNHNDEAMANYFSSMLNEKKQQEVIVESPPKPLTISSLPEHLVFAQPEQLLEQPEQQCEPETVVNVKQDIKQTVKVDAKTDTKAAEQNAHKDSETSWKNIDVGNEFQVLFFELSGLTFAVPLTDLGGIHPLDDSINTLIGKPAWFSGVMTHNQSLFNIVDTAKWINTGESAKTLHYSHYILLGATPWGLSCEKLLGTETLTQSQIKWRESRGKRPWLAGMVKEKMCALIHADELVKLLNSGMNIHGQ